MSAGGGDEHGTARGRPKKRTLCPVPDTERGDKERGRQPEPRAETGVQGTSSTPTSRVSQGTAGFFLQLQRRAGNRAVVEHVLKAPASARPGPATRLPAALRRRAEQTSGLDLTEVRVHSGSPAPAALGAAAFTRGNDIFLGPGDERHLAHEIWHVVQQRSGRVQATTHVEGFPANKDPDLENEADQMAHQTRPALRQDAEAHDRTALAAGVIQGVFLYEVASTAGQPRWLDTDTNTYFVPVAWHDTGVVTVRSVGIEPSRRIVLRQQQNGDWLPSALTEQEVGEAEAVMDVDENKGPFAPPSAEKTVTPKDQAERALVDKGFRLARLSTDFTVQVDVAPGNQGQLSVPDNPKSHLTYGPDDVIATGLTVGNKDRPDTYLEPKKATKSKKASSSIPQGRHTVAWSFMRRSFAAMTGWSVSQILQHLQTGVAEAARLLQTAEGQFMLTLTQVEQQPGMVVSTLSMFSQPGTRLTIETWQSTVSEAIRYYAQVYHLSSGATFAGTSKSRDESGGLRYLEAYEERLMSGEAATEKTGDLQKAALKLLDAVQSMAPAAYAFAVAHWIELLGDVYPNVMKSHGRDMVDPILTTKLGKTYSSEIEKQGTVADLLAFYGYPLPFPFVPHVEPQELNVEGEMEPYEDAYGGSSEFVATVSLSEEIPQEAGASLMEVAGLQGKKLTVRALLPGEVVVRKVIVSDQDRPDTKAGAKQNSHTLAWTAVRAELVSLSGQPLGVLLDFLLAEFGELSKENGGKHQDLVKHAITELSKLKGKRRPIHLWQSDASLAVKWYAHAHQLAPSTTFYDVAAHGAFGHGEAAHMEVLRANETSAYNENKLVHQPERVVEAAYKLMDVTPTLSAQVRRTTFRKWKAAMCRTFPVLMGGMGKDMIAACVKYHNLASDLSQADLAL